MEEVCGSEVGGKRREVGERWEIGGGGGRRRRVPRAVIMRDVN